METSVLRNFNKIERCSLSGMPKHVFLDYESFDMVCVLISESHIYINDIISLVGIITSSELNNFSKYMC